MKNLLRYILPAVLISASPAMADDQNHAKDAGRGLREMALKRLPSDFQPTLKPTHEFPRIYGVLMDWPLGEQTVTIFSLSTGDASLYTTSTFGVIGGFSHENVRTAAIHLVRMADAFFDDAVPATAYPYPKPGHIRFYLLTFNGVRVIDADQAAVESGSNRYTPLFAAAQDVMTQLRLVVQNHK